jgi:N-acetylneuraminic acid mutarotase
MKSVISWDAANAAGAGAWDAAEVPDLDENRKWAAAAWLRGKLYVIGGDVGAEEYSKQCHRWDPANPAAGWERVADLGNGRCYHAAAVLGGALYAVAGELQAEVGGDMTASVERYDPDTNAWAAVAPLPSARYDTSTAVLDDKMYVLGGWGHAGHLKSCACYSAATGAWEALPDMQHARGAPAAAVFDGKLWVTGGYDDDGYNLASVEVYDPASNTWDRTKADMTTARCGHVAAVLNGELHVVGGVSESVEKYDPGSNSWAVVPAMQLPEARDGCSGAAVCCV